MLKYIWKPSLVQQNGQVTRDTRKNPTLRIYGMSELKA